MLLPRPSLQVAAIRDSADTSPSHWGPEEADRGHTVQALWGARRSPAPHLQPW